MMRLLAATLVVWAGAVWPCSPAPWIKSAPRDNPAAYARTLLEKYSVIVRAKVISSGLEPSDAPKTNLIGFADIEVLERFKGPEDIKRIFTRVHMVTCANPEFIPGEERLFVLYQDSGRLYEAHAWTLPGYSDATLVALFRIFGSQSNSAAESDAFRPALAAPSRSAPRRER